MLTKELVLNCLKQVQDPELFKDIVTLGMVKELEIINNEELNLIIELTTPACPLAGEIEQDIRNHLAEITEIKKLNLTMTGKVKEKKQQEELRNIRNIILVGSGKGGVGKSTVAVNLAVSLANMGAKVGLIDADIYGPSVNILMGSGEEKMMTYDGKTMMPLMKHNVKFVSIGAIVDKGQALIWRGPMLQSILLQFVKEVYWEELDYLVIDLPPGTGDVQLTLAQNIKSTGAVIVSTPQDVALSDVLRAKDMFDKVNLPILGIVENMSYFLCPHCGERTEIFSNGGAKKTAEKYNIEFLGEIPVNTEIRQGSDSGIPVALNKESSQYEIFNNIAKKLAGKISVLSYGK